MTSAPMTTAEDMIASDFVFKPTDERLVGHYLPHKICGNDNLVSVIAEIGNICNYDPWDLPWLAAIHSEDTWYFFSRPDRKYRGNTNRLTRSGYWKVTGQERGIKNRAKNQVIGFKRILVFYRGRVRDPKWTNWTIHEYYLKSSSNGEDYVISRLHRKPPRKTANSLVDEGERGHDSASEVENLVMDPSSPVLDSNGQDFTFPIAQQPVMHTSQDPSYPNLQHTIGATDDYTRSLSQFGTTAQQDIILEGKYHPAIQDAHSYGGSMQMAPSDFGPLQSSGSQPFEDISDTEVNELLAWFDADDNDLRLDRLFEPASACFP